MRQNSLDSSLPLFAQNDSYLCDDNIYEKMSFQTVNTLTENALAPHAILTCEASIPA